MDGKTVAIVALGSALVVVFLLALFLVRWICVLNRPYQRQRNVKPAHTSMIDDTIIASDSPESSGRLALLPLSTADDLSQDASPTEIPALDICSSLESPELPPKPIQPSLALTKTAISDKGEKRNTHEVVHIRNRSGSGRMNDSGSVGKSGFGSFQGPAIEIPIDDIPPENSAFPNDSSLSSKVEGDTPRFRLLWKDHSPILSVSIPLDTISAALTSRANTITSQTTESDNGSCRVFRREQSTIAPQTRQSSAIRSNRTKLERTGSIEYEELTDEIEDYLTIEDDDDLQLTANSQKQESYGETEPIASTSRHSNEGCKGNMFLSLTGNDPDSDIPPETTPCLTPAISGKGGSDRDFKFESMYMYSAEQSRPPVSPRSSANLSYGERPVTARSMMNLSACTNDTPPVAPRSSANLLCDERPVTVRSMMNQSAYTDEAPPEVASRSHLNNMRSSSMSCLPTQPAQTSSTPAQEYMYIDDSDAFKNAPVANCPRHAFRGNILALPDGTKSSMQKNAYTSLTGMFKASPYTMLSPMCK